MSKSKQDIINERQANLPLPEQPPTASDWNSADERTVNVGSGRLEGDISAGDGSSSLRSPATGDSAVRTDGGEWKTNTSGMNVGRTAKDGLDGLPNDAVTRDKKNAANTVDTTGKDYGYPERNDPSSGLK
jgi:hypothetical protein